MDFSIIVRIFKGVWRTKEIAMNLLTIDEAAAYLGGVKIATLRKWVHLRRIPYIKLAGGSLVRFRAEDLDSVIQSGLVSVRQGGREGKA